MSDRLQSTHAISCDGHPAQVHAGTRWGKTLAKEGGSFECWKSQLLVSSTPGAGEADLAVQAVGDAAAGLNTGQERVPSAPAKPRFTLRDDGSEVEVCAERHAACAM